LHDRIRRVAARCEVVSQSSAMDELVGSAQRSTVGADIAACVARLVVAVRAARAQVVGVARGGIEPTDVGCLDNVLVAIAAVGVRECLAVDAASYPAHALHDVVPKLGGAGPVGLTCRVDGPGGRRRSAASTALSRLVGFRLELTPPVIP
jgi:hypothetical protein